MSENYQFLVRSPSGQVFLAETQQEAKALAQQLGSKVERLFKNPDEVQIPNDIAKKYKNAASTWVAIQLRLGNQNVLSQDVQKAIEQFYQIQEQKLGRFLRKKNIFDIASTSELLEIVEEAYPKYTAHNAEKAYKSRYNKEGQKLLYEDSDWLLYTPTTKGAAVALGEGTKWCTAAPGLKYYEQYTKKAPLYIFIDKRDGEKYQVWVSKKGIDAQYMTKEDEEIENPFVWIKINEILEKLGLPTKEFREQVLAVEKDYIKTLEVEYWGKNDKIHRDGDLPAVIWRSGVKRWYKNGKRHRDGDLPAEIWEDGHRWWYKNGKLHRDGDLPTEISGNGTKYWEKDGKLHRDGDLPAVIYANGSQLWYKNGVLHRDGDLPVQIWADGSQSWYKNGKLHRDGDLPAVIQANGNQVWYKNGAKHRAGDLPAAAFADGGREWWKNGQLHRDGDLPAAVYASGAKVWYKHGRKIKFTQAEQRFGINTEEK